MWKFDGQSPSDTSGNGNNGTVNGGFSYSSNVPSGDGGGGGGGGSGSSAQIKWLVTDHLGTPRMIVDQSGSLTITDQNGNYVSGMTRHDYLPFGEEGDGSTGHAAHDLRSDGKLGKHFAS